MISELTAADMALYPYSEPKARVGACIATATQFGPGRYSVLARVPKTSDASTDGRGYVFAMWTFAYSEIYANNPGGCPGRGNESRGPATASPLAMFEKSAEGSTGTLFPALPGIFAQGSSCDDGFMTVHNHEIDIEIPANSPAFMDTPDLWSTHLTWGSMNCNTWISDTAVYEGTSNYYTQAQASVSDLPLAAARKPASFVSENGEFHWYEIDWRVDPTDPSRNTVSWYFDGQLVYTTRRFVPLYGGRLVVGPWPAHWGVRPASAGGPMSMRFDVAHVDVAELRVLPQQLVLDVDSRGTPTPTCAILAMPQTYDQKLPNGELYCGFRPLCSQQRVDTSCASTLAGVSRQQGGGGDDALEGITQPCGGNSGVWCPPGSDTVPSWSPNTGFLTSPGNPMTDAARRSISKAGGMRCGGDTGVPCIGTGSVAPPKAWWSRHQTAVTVAALSLVVLLAVLATVRWRRLALLRER
jgi:hypothetical protein